MRDESESRGVFKVFNFTRRIINVIRKQLFFKTSSVIYYSMTILLENEQSEFLLFLTK